MMISETYALRLGDAAYKFKAVTPVAAYTAVIIPEISLLIAVISG